MSLCRVFSCVVGRGCWLWSGHSPSKILLAFALLYSVLQGLICPFSSIQFSRSVMSNSLWHHELQHSRPPCLSPTPGVHPNSCPLSQWCHPTISSSVVPFSSCPQSFHHQGLFKWVSCLYQLAKILEFQLQHQSFQWTLCLLFQVFLDFLLLLLDPCYFCPLLSLLSFIFAWNVPLVSLIFLKRSLVFSILLLSFISLHCSLKKAFISLLDIFGTLHSGGYIFPFLLCL